MEKEPEMYGRISTVPEKIDPEKKEYPKNVLNGLQLGHELVYGLALFQFLFVYLPYGFLNIAGVNVPYTDVGFLLAFVMIIGLSGIILGAFTFMIYNAQKKKKAFKGKKPQTLYSLTEKGKKAFAEYLKGLEKIIQSRKLD